MLGIHQCCTITCNWLTFCFLNKKECHQAVPAESQEDEQGGQEMSLPLGMPHQQCVNKIGTSLTSGQTPSWTWEEGSRAVEFPRSGLHSSVNRLQKKSCNISRLKYRSFSPRTWRKKVKICTGEIQILPEMKETDLNNRKLFSYKMQEKHRECLSCFSRPLLAPALGQSWRKGTGAESSIFLTAFI